MSREGLRTEKKGFEKYRGELLAEVERVAAAAEKRVLARAAADRKKLELRMKDLAKLNGKK